MIPTRLHGVIDYLYGLLLLAAPFMLGFADGGSAQGVMMAFGAGAILYSLVTAYELGAVKLIPMPMHLALDVGAGIVLAASPWLFGFADQIWWPHVLAGGTSILVPLLTRRRPQQPDR